jgi:hypothetical protein
MTGEALFIKSTYPIWRASRQFSLVRPIPIETDFLEGITTLFNEDGPYGFTTGLSAPPAQIFYQVWGARSFSTVQPSAFKGEKSVFVGANTTGGFNTITYWREVLGDMPEGEWYRIRVQGTSSVAGVLSSSRTESLVAQVQAPIP